VAVTDLPEGPISHARHSTSHMLPRRVCVYVWWPDKKSPSAQGSWAGQPAINGDHGLSMIIGFAARPSRTGMTLLDGGGAPTSNDACLTLIAGLSFSGGISPLVS
jgi:hypothetical protein